MKLYLFPTGLFLAASFFTGCPKPAPKNAVIEPGKPFTLAQGQTKQTADKAFSILFHEVADDSRCPEGTQCIWAGKADCVVTLDKNGASETFTLTVGDLKKGGVRQVSYGGYTVTLLALAPGRKPGEVLAQKDYTATLEVK